MPKRVPPELSSVADRIGLFMRYWGFTKIDGRIWTHLYLAPAPISAAELRERLSVSKALVSLSLKQLLKFGVIRQAGSAKHGTSLFESVPDLQSVVENVLRTRERQMLADISSAARLLTNSATSERKLPLVDASKSEKLLQMCESAEVLFDQMVLSQHSLSAISNFDDPPK